LSFRRIERSGSRLEDAFDDFARVHLVEGFAPVCERRNAIEDQVELELAAGEEREYFFPDWPVVREATLQRDSFLHERVERKIQRLRAPTDFGDASGGADDIERQLQRRGDAGGVDDKIEAVAIAESFNPFMDGLAMSAEYCLGAEFFCDIEPPCVRGNTDDDKMSGTSELGHQSAEQSDGTGADYGDGITGADVRMDTDGVVGDAAGFGERGEFEGKARRNSVQAARGHADERRHCAVDSIAETEALWIEVVEALANECGVVGKYGGRFANYAVTLLEAAYTIAFFRDDSGKFVTEDDRKIYVPTLRPRILVKIAAANSNCLDGKENVFFAEFRFRNIAQFDRMRFL